MSNRWKIATTLAALFAKKQQNTSMGFHGYEMDSESKYDDVTLLRQYRKKRNRLNKIARASRRRNRGG